MTTYVDIQDRVTPSLAGFSSRLRAEAPTRVGDAVVKLFQNHFLSLPPNKEGWPSTGFWAEAAQACSYDVLDGGVEINVNKVGVAQRRWGGPIVPVNAKWLTVPARADAYGRRASDFADLRFEFFKWNVAALVKDSPVSPRDGEERNDVVFWLYRAVNQDPDPTVMPSDQSIEATVANTIVDLQGRFFGRW